MCVPWSLQPIDLSHAGMAVPRAQRTVVFVLGGPGSGKGTQVMLMKLKHAMQIVFQGCEANHRNQYLSARTSNEAALSWMHSLRHAGFTHDYVARMSSAKYLKRQSGIVIMQGVAAVCQAGGRVWPRTLERRRSAASTHEIWYP